MSSLFPFVSVTCIIFSKNVSFERERKIARWFEIYHLLLFSLSRARVSIHLTDGYASDLIGS